MSGDNRVLYCGLSVLSSQESSLLAQVTIKLSRDPEYLEVTAQLCDSGKDKLCVHMKPRLLVKEVAGEDVQLSDLSGDEAFWVERVVPYINNRLHVHNTSGGRGKYRISINCGPDLIIPGPCEENSTTVRSDRQGASEPRRRKSEPHNTVCDGMLKSRPAQPKVRGEDSHVMSDNGYDRPVEFKPEQQQPTRQRPTIMQSLFGCVAAFACTFEPDDVVEEIMQRYQAIDEPNGNGKSKPPAASPLSELELFRFAAHLRVDFRHNALLDHGRMPMPFDPIRETDDQKVLFRGLGTASIGTVGAQILFHTSRKLFEVIIYSLEGPAGLDVLARLYVDFDDLLPFVDPEQVEEVFHRFLEVPSWRSRSHSNLEGSISMKHAALRTDAMLNVMVEYLLSHVLAFQLPSTGAIIVQITAEWGQPELTVHSQPPPTKKAKQPVIRTEYTSQDATSPINARKTPPSVSIVKQKRAQPQAGVMSRLAAWMGLRSRVVPAGAEAMTPHSPCTTVRSSNTAGTRQSQSHSLSHSVHCHDYYDAQDGDGTESAAGAGMSDAGSRRGSSTRTAASRGRTIPTRHAPPVQAAQDPALLHNRLVPVPA